MALDALEPSAATQTLTERMARALHALEPGALPGAVTAKAKLCLFDFLACALASRELPWSRQAIALATHRAVGAPADSGASDRGPPVDGAALIGTPYRTSVADATFANAVLGHGLVRDDMHLGSVSHLGVVVLPPLLALAETRPVAGRVLLAAIAAGY
jgi:2-methylcitrate dehydratase PrpD